MKILFLLAALMLSIQKADAPVHKVNRERLQVMSSWYCKGFAGRLTASGVRYNCRGLTVAHPDYPFGTRIWLQNPRSGQQVIATVNDRGPYIPRRGLDTSELVAERLGFHDQGLALLDLVVLELGREK